MNERTGNRLRGILMFAAIVEIGTGLALLIDPRFVVSLLIGTNLPIGEIPIGRLLGIAILALGLACWPSGPDARSDSPAFRAMLVYNALIALFLAYLFTVEHIGGVLLWPGVALHAVVALLLVSTWLSGRPNPLAKA